MHNHQVYYIQHRFFAITDSERVPHEDTIRCDCA